MGWNPLCAVSFLLCLLPLTDSEVRSRLSSPFPAVPQTKTSQKPTDLNPSQSDTAFTRRPLRRRRQPVAYPGHSSVLETPILALYRTNLHTDRAKMSASLPGSRELPASQYDLGTYTGRVKHAMGITDPR